MPKKIGDNNAVVQPTKPVEKIVTNAEIKQRVLSKAEQMKTQLDAQPKVMILIPLERGEKKGATQPFCINGYRFEVPKGVMTSVSEQVAKMISERFAVELDVRSRSIGQKEQDVKTALDE
jgi:hypothetical protein